jgi:hypothetical protein
VWGFSYAVPNESINKSTRSLSYRLAPATIVVPPPPPPPLLLLTTLLMIGLPLLEIDCFDKSIFVCDTVFNFTDFGATAAALGGVGLTDAGAATLGGTERAAVDAAAVGAAVDAAAGAAAGAGAGAAASCVEGALGFLA